ncbi:MAG: hypothetical protein MJA83_20125 [Gammaproteobacteria bacterium]|nr:hypothetical protein [Gammaproteobacteria bacterium]
MKARIKAITFAGISAMALAATPLAMADETGSGKTSRSVRGGSSFTHVHVVKRQSARSTRSFSFRWLRKRFIWK